MRTLLILSAATALAIAMPNAAFAAAAASNTTAAGTAESGHKMVLTDKSTYKDIMDAIAAPGTAKTPEPLSWACRRGWKKCWT